MTVSNFISRLKQEKGILVLGHRGVRNADIPENTLPAFRRAFDLGADGIEIDVETSADGRLVVINRWYAQKNFGFFPWERDFAAIRAAGLPAGAAIPGFEEVCDLIRQHGRAVFNVEIKSSDRGLCRTAKQAGAVIGRFGIGRQVIVSSFDLNTLLTMKRCHPGIETAYLFRREDRVTDLNDKNTLKYRVNGMINRSGIKAVIAAADTLHPEIKLVGRKRKPLWQSYAGLTGRRINCWTVDTEADFEKAVRIGATSVISDDPRTALEFRTKM